MENKEELEKEKKEILEAVSDFFKNKNLYTDVHGGEPVIGIRNLTGLKTYGITTLFFEYDRDNMYVYYLDGDNTIVWKTAVLPIEQFPEAHKMFFDTYEQLEPYDKWHPRKISKDEIEENKKRIKVFLENIEKRKDKQEQCNTSKPKFKLLQVLKSILYPKMKKKVNPYQKNTWR